MKKIYLFGLAFLGLLAASCQEQEIIAPVEDSPVGGNYTIVAQMEQGVETRTTVEYDETKNQYKVLWAEGDKISVFTVCNKISF